MTNRRDFLTILAGASWAGVGCSETPPRPEPPMEDEIERALQDLNQAAGIGITGEDFEMARAYAAGAHREAARSLRPIALDAGLDLPVAFAAKRDR